MRLRLSALQSALRKGPVAAFRGGQGATAVAGDLAAGDGAAGRYPLRERRATKGALAETMLMRSKPVCLAFLTISCNPGQAVSEVPCCSSKAHCMHSSGERKVQKISGVQQRACNLGRKPL